MYVRIYTNNLDLDMIGGGARAHPINMAISKHITFLLSEILHVCFFFLILGGEWWRGRDERSFVTVTHATSVFYLHDRQSAR